jgi:ABC-type transporter Mla MlaB component
MSRGTPIFYHAAGPCFSAEDARSVKDQALAANPTRSVNVDLSRVERATTAAMACLILLRGRLLIGGGDLCISGLHGRVEGLYQISRLAGVLPQAG